MPKLAFIVATNNEDLLQKNFLSSKVAREGKCPIVLQRGYRNIGKAYNDAMSQVDAEFLVCLHQDVFLPDSWEEQVVESIRSLKDGHWGVLGVAGIKLVDRQRIFVGHALDRGLEIGSAHGLPAKVDTLDELLLIIRNDRKLLFDELIPATHFYGADICLEASNRGMDCYAIEAYCHHNSIDSNSNSPQFQMAWKYMQKKWEKRLPFATTVALVESKSVVNIRRIVNGLGLQPVARPIAAKLRGLRKQHLARKPR